MTTELERFTQGFRDEHRGARDWLMATAQAFRDRNTGMISMLLDQGDAGFGQHMQYEEETMYPALVDMYGKEWVEEMISDHDRGIGMVMRLRELSEREPITHDHIAEAERLIQRQFPHVTDCDGLVLAIEALSEDVQGSIFASRDRALAEGITMMQWSERRGRTPIMPS